MMVGVIGVGNVGTSCAKALLLRGSCNEIVLIDTNESRVKGVCADLTHGSVLCPPTKIKVGDYSHLSNCSVVIVTAGINEQAGNAIDKNDPRGRLLLLPPNTQIYNEIIPQIMKVNVNAPILVVTDPPDALADIARRFKPSNQIISSGTFLDTLRFKIQIANRLKCHPSSVDAMVIGEHGTSQVYVWSSARVGGELVLDLVDKNGWDRTEFKRDIEKDVKHANIDIIEGTGASQHGIGIVVARLVEAILRDEGLVAPVGIFQEEYDTTFSLPSVINKKGVAEVIKPTLSADEEEALKISAAVIKSAVDEI